MYYDILWQSVFGIPYIVVGGIVTFFFLMATYAVIALNKAGYHKIPLKYHFLLGKITVLLGLFHGILGIILYLP